MVIYRLHLNTPEKMIKLVSTFAITMLTASAHAQSVTAILNTVDPRLDVRGTFDNVTTSNYASGVANFTSTAGAFDGFCAEPLQGINFSAPVVFEVQDPSSLTNHQQVGRIVSAYLASSQTAAQAAAAQWAIWEVTNESQVHPSSLSTGNIRVNIPAFAGTQALADAYLATMHNFAPTPFVLLSNATRQDFVTWTPGIVAIPEPSSMLLIAVSGLGLLRRRRN